MRKFMITIRSAVCVALLSASALSTAPASAQDIFGNFFRLFSAPAQRAPVYEHQHAPRVVAPRAVRLRPKVVRADAAAIKTPIKAKGQGARNGSSRGCAGKQAPHKAQGARRDHKMLTRLTPARVTDQSARVGGVPKDGSPWTASITF